MYACFLSDLISSISIHTVENVVQTIYQIYRGIALMASLARQILPPNPGAHTFHLNFPLKLSVVEEKSKTTAEQYLPNCQKSHEEKQTL